MTDEARVRELRELLPATGAGIYLATHELGPLPAEAAAAMREADDWELRVGRVSAGRAEDVAQRDAEARSVVAALIGADPDELVLVHGVRHARELAAAKARDLSLLAGASPVSVVEAGTAVFFACDRWLLGPEGTAAVWLPTAARAAAVRQQADPLPRTTLVGLARAVGWLEMYVGLDWIYARTAALAARLRDGLTALGGVNLSATADAPHVLSFVIANWSAAEAADELSRRVFALLSVDSARALQVSVGWFNSEAEIDRFVAAVAELAAHTPATLLRRRGLEVL
jgi:selenocysteine lyase/cysteine desulfurase